MCALFTLQVGETTVVLMREGERVDLKKAWITNTLAALHGVTPAQVQTIIERAVMPEKKQPALTYQMAGAINMAMPIIGFSTFAGHIVSIDGELFAAVNDTQALVDAFEDYLIGSPLWEAIKTWAATPEAVSPGERLN